MLGADLTKLIAALLLVLAAVACSGTRDAPLPSSASFDSVNGHDLGPDQVAVPFPNSEQFEDGLQQWVARPSANGPVVVVIWKDREVAAIPLEMLGIDPAVDTLVNRPELSTISLGGNSYATLSVIGDPEDSSGWIVLQELLTEG